MFTIKTMEGILLLIFLVILIVLIGVPLWRRYQGTTTVTTTPTTTTTTTTGNCFTPSTFPVKSGIFDLRNCTDDVYILLNSCSDQSRVHIVTECP